MGFTVRTYLHCALLALASALLGAPVQAVEPDRTAAQLRIEPAGPLVLHGRDDRRQLLVTNDSPEGARDVTQQAHLQVSPPGIVDLSPTGWLLPRQDGTAVIRAEFPGATAVEITVQVVDTARPQPVNFPNQVVPIFTKFSCNSGGCHGKSGGQNGFALSLLGFFPEDDYEYLVKDSRGRRVFPAAPETSLLLAKATGQVPHGGGKRIDAESDEYRLLTRWIAQGLTYGSPTDPHVTALECIPAARMLARGLDQQLVVLAHYSDGSRQDVTRAALFEANNTDMAEVSTTGRVSIRDQAGEVAVMARYQGQVAVFRATVPLGAPILAWPATRNGVDEAVFRKLAALGIPPSPVSDDATFLRRITLDLTGTIPTESQVREFLADAAPDKRDRLIDTLLASPAYADYFATKWNALLRNRTGKILNGQRIDNDLPGTYALHRWIWQSLRQNKPYDRFVTELLTAAGDRSFNPAVVWYREVDEVQEQVEDVAQLFMGTRIQCARCHHHPFEKWSQDDYYRLSAFFTQLGKKPAAGAAVIAKNDASQSRDLRIFHRQGIATATYPRATKPLTPAGLGSPPLVIPADRDPRSELATWLVKRENPFFARTLVNRYWKHFFGRGVVEPEDDFRATNPPSNPELLAALEQWFVAHDYDLQGLIRLICQSSSYQLSALPNEHNLFDKQNFSRHYPRRLPAEALFDAFQQVTNVREPFAGLPTATRAVQLPDASQANYFLQVFGRPQGDTACECERVTEASLAQSLHFVNGEEVQRRLANRQGRAAGWAADPRPHAEKVAELYRWALAREPRTEEQQIAVSYLERHPANVQAAYEDLLWAILTSNEFLFNN